MRKEAMLWEKQKENMVHCFLCAHHCRIKDEGFGICGMRQNTGGRLYTYAYGSVIANQVDHIEKKPLYHFLPGTYAYSIATFGCNFKCSFCQNWSISQLSVKNGDIGGEAFTPEDIVKEALKNHCRSISYTYTEPTVFFEYAYDTAQLAKEKGLKNSFVTNGYMTDSAIDKISPYLDAANVDLKFFRNETYKRICSGRLEPVLASIRKMKEKGIWVEVTTLLVPGENDSEEEVRDIARFLREIDKGIPWHISRFHPDYKYTDSFPTPIGKMERAREIGIEEGLKYVYLGNVQVVNETLCPSCGKVMIERPGFSAIITSDFTAEGKCASCGALIDGVWK